MKPSSFVGIKGEYEELVARFKKEIPTEENNLLTYFVDKKNQLLSDISCLKGEINIIDKELEKDSLKREEYINMRAELEMMEKHLIDLF